MGGGGHFVLSILCALLALAYAVGQQCEDTAYGRSCALPSPPETVSLIDGKLYVGSIDELLAFQAGEIQFVESVSLSAPEEKITSCLGSGLSSANCRNYLRVIEPIANGTNDRILVCGTNANSPKCTWHEREDFSSWGFMTESTLTDGGFSPYSNTMQFAGILATNDRFFSGTPFSRFKLQPQIGMSPTPLLGNNSFAVQTLDSDPFWLNKPEFVSSYEIGDYIYFFMTEEAYEVDFGASVVYGRAARVCKNDDGIQHGQERTFRTFQKIRIKCSFSANSADFPYDYNILKGTYLWRSQTSSESILYGVFSSPENGPPGAAVCRFSFNENDVGSLGQVFSTNSYQIYDTSPQVQEWVADPGTVFTCADYTSRPASEATSHLLLTGAGASTSIRTVSGTEFTHVAADRMENDGEEFEVVYYSLTTGEIGQVVVMGTDTYDSIIFNAENAVLHFEIFPDESSGVQYLYIITEDSIRAVERGNCAAYLDCFQCFDSKDPNCAWDTSEKSCRRRSSQSSSLVELFSSPESTVVTHCGPRPTAPPTTTPPPTCGTGSVTGEDNNSGSDSPPNSSGTGTEPAECTEAPTTTNKPGGVSTADTGFSLPELIGGTAGGFFGGFLIGLVICALFFKLFIKKKRKTVSGSRRRRARGDAENGVTTVNNQLETTAQRKEQMLNGNHYVDHQLPGPGPGPGQPVKNVNQYDTDGDGDDDVLTDLPSSNTFKTGNGVKPHTAESHDAPPTRVLHKPMASSGRVPRGRTESTRWLRASESSDPSDSPMQSPL